ncbi:flagellin [Pandoraea sputorum]|uniref:flagellin N-terminal helical domain-containing protein n=1 Tax=Pandoraea sputorum TaxID=93222 RepID=UPI001E52E7D7|nr:flagellin [Pandoraea sputorum]MCE4061477.1 flagellin [Pandoraea sputorum]
MSSVINTNIFSTIAQRNLSTSQSSLQTSITRLSSGLRINSAADDAAGLAITDRMTSQINGLTQAQRNANDGISLVQTAAGGLSSISDNLQRIRTLAVQATNATNSASDRAAIDQEVQQRLSEITRTAQQTQFNGLSVLNGTMGAANFQVGANAGQSISVSLSQNMGAGSIGGVALATATTAAKFGSITLDAANTISVGGTAVASGTYNTAADLAAAINTAAGTNIAAANAATGEIDFSNTTAAAINMTTTGLTGITVPATLAATTGTGSSTGVKTALSPLTLSGTDLQIKTAGATAATSITGTFKTVGELADAISASGSGVTAFVDSTGKLNLVSSQNFTVSGTAAKLTQIGVAAGSSAVSGSLSTANALTVDSATKLVAQIDAAIGTADSFNATLGAIQNRFQSAVSNLSATTQNLTSARSGVQDTDYAAETANMTRSQILQQAGISMLSQANQLPQQVLKLLQ